MSTSLPQFVQDLADSGLMSEEKQRAFSAVIGSSRLPDNADILARHLVKQGLLTSYQAAEALAGRCKGLVLGNYEVLEKIGEGGMGVVVKARHRRMDRVVALKLLPAATVGSPEKLRRFVREVKTAAKLVHHNIVTAYDADVADATHFLVMEYVEGEDLLSVVRREHPLPVERVVGYIIQAARGLEYAHEQGVVHRDIKPANLLLSADGTIKILDVGLARLSGVAEDAPVAGAASPDDLPTAEGLTIEGVFMGTVDYMAPEQAVDTRRVDQRADIYSLGATLFRILANRPMYDVEGMVKKIIAHRDAPIPSLRDYREDVPLELDVIYQKMVAKKPEDRYQNVGDLIKDLRDAVIFPANKPGAARTGGWSNGGHGPTAEEVRDTPTQILTLPDERTQVLSSRPVDSLAQISAAGVEHRERSASTIRARISPPPVASRRPTRMIAAAIVMALVLIGVVTAVAMLRETEPPPLQDIDYAVAEPGRWTDLLEGVELDAFVVSGPWKREDRAIISPRGRVSALGFPLKWPEQYRIEMVVEPKEPAALSIGLSQYNEPFAITIDRPVDGRLVSGIGPQREAGPAVSVEGYRGGLLTVDRSNLISILVTRAGIKAIVNNELVADVTAPPSSPKGTVNKSPFPQRRLAYVMSTGQFVLHRMQLTSIQPADSPATAADNDRKPVDLRPLIDRSRHKDVREVKERSETKLRTPDHFVALDINYLLPDEYDLEFSIERYENAGGFAIGLTNHRHPFSVYFNWDREAIQWADPFGGSPIVYGLGYVDDKPLVEAESRKEAGWLLRRISSLVKVSVREKRIVVTVDGNRMVEWEGEPSMLWDDTKPDPLKTGYPWIRATGEYRIGRMVVTPHYRPAEQAKGATVGVR